MNRFLLVLFCIVSYSVLAQNEYFIKDKITNEPVPFVKVIPNTGNPFLADLDGKFSYTIDSPFQLKTPGYKDTLIDIKDITDNIIFLNPLTREIQEVTVVAGENPAHRIMNTVIANRKKNNPMENDAFRYSSYSKFIFTANQDGLDSIPADTQDTTLQKIRKFFTEQHLFMIESSSNRTFMPPAFDKEEITAYKVSGFTDPMFSTFANEMQSFSFYENQFELMGKTYINPIAFGGTKRYLFILEDTTVVGSDTTFTIFYRPRKGKNFDGMTGHLYINTNGYAIEKVTASPYEDTSGTEIRIVQEYEILNGYKWFPTKLSTEINFKKMVIAKWKDGYFQGRGNTYIKDVNFNPEGIRKKEFDNINISTNIDAGSKSDSDWDSLRIYEITEREKRTYAMIDSFAKVTKFDNKLRIIKILMEGKIPLGYFNLPINRLIDFNTYEGYRFGAGLETSSKLMKNIIIGGYYSWANRDKVSKYGSYATFYLDRRTDTKIQMRYQFDIIERGGPNFPNQYDPKSSENLRQFLINSFDQQRLAEIGFSKRINSNFKVNLSGNYQRLFFTNDYLYYPNTDTLLAMNTCDLAETTLDIDWSIREKYMLLGEQLIGQGSKYPRIKLRISKGWKDWFESDFDYIRLNMNVSQSIAIRGFANFNWCISGGQTFGSTPLSLQQVTLGTGKPWSISVMNTFETVAPSEFYNTRQAAIFTRLDLLPIKTKAKWNEPQFCFHNAYGIGDFSGINQHSLNFKSMEKVLYETGFIMNNLYISGFSGVGFGVFYRYGSYSMTDWRKNIYPKISVSFNF